MPRGAIGEVSGTYIPSWNRVPGGSSEGVDGLTGILVVVLEDDPGRSSDVLCLTDDDRARPWAEGPADPSGCFEVWIPRMRILLIARVC